ncbi:acyl-CoA dehydrogenase family protein [Neobacillus mesonae]|uniref:acyl-CoA dehydrogenase family protein n=1 Tax=Neobacillus mesonae TaxID=1193713 RepID=UPI00203C8BE9|nr:acyl-CoA dehydrogenase family protein [Neobacillus mesonae]MCM3567492.1 acyl-CoA/acyl-ACP dehydrogenase [Neobacillus mesonae]
MSEMQEMIIDSTIKIMEKFSTKEVVNEAEQGQWAAELWNVLVEYGMTSVAIPEELGGSDGDYADAFSILRLAGKYSAPVPLAETFLANWLLSELGEYVTTEIMTISYSNNSNPLQFVKEDSGWIVMGKVKNVPWARFAEKLLIQGEAEEGSILALINLKHANIVKGHNLAGEARDEVVFNQVLMDDCKIFSVNSNQMADKIYYGGALTRAIMMAGALENIFELTVNYASERSQFGRPINRFQAVQHHLALLAGETAAANMAANCAVAAFQKASGNKEIALAKIRVNEAAGKASPIAHQVLAAIGFTYEHTLHHSTRRLWAWRDEFGTETDWEKIIAKDLLKLQQNQLWSLVTEVINEEKVEIK